MRDAAGRILIVRPSALGDVCRTVPALASLRRAFPRAVIDWVVNDAYADAIRAHPDLNEVVPFPRSRFAGWWRSARISTELREWFRSLRARKYDLVFDLQGLSRSALITAMTRARRRVGFSSAREMAWFGYNVRHRPPESAHIVDQMLELLQREGIHAVPDWRLHAPAEDVAWWTSERAHRGIDHALAVFAPTTRWQCKRWPLERWSELVEPLVERGIERFIIIGAPNERAQVEGMIADLAQRFGERIVDLVGRATIGRTMAVIRSASLVIANDSAPLHMAVGFERPIIGLYGPTDPAFVGPWRRDETVIRCYDTAREGPINFRSRKTDDALMRRIAPRMVIERIDRLYPALIDRRAAAEGCRW